MPRKIDKPRPLTPKEQRFVEEYLVDLNQAAAYRRAGYKGKNADVHASRMMVKRGIAEAIAAAQAARSKRTQITADDVLRELIHLGKSDIGDILDFTGDQPRLRPASSIPESARRAISSVKTKRYIEGHGEDATTVELVEFKLWDKLGALRDIGKHLGMFVERSETVNLTPEQLAALSPDQLRRLAAGEPVLLVLTRTDASQPA